jgi:hypothetical protein
MSRRNWGRWLLSGAVAVGCLAGPGVARADRGTIKFPGVHPDYSFEAEPHLILTPIDLPRGSQGGWGAGFRGTIELLDNGFVKTINNTVGLGLGVDTFFHKHAAVWVPVVMQWNFWFSEQWSLFGEPGGGIIIGDRTEVQPSFAVGGRWLFTKDMSLTLRGGWPTVSVGLSFLL